MSAKVNLENESVQFAGTVEGVLDPRQHDELIGHAEPKAQLERAFANDRFPQAWLLQGAEGIGKASFAWHFARRLVEFGAIDNRPIPQNVMERYARGSQTDIYDVTFPADDKGGYKSQITVESLRALSEKLALSAPDGAWRVVIIDPAEAMNANAANALLKLLEEPPARVLFFLVTHAPHKLLPTIHSRCQKLRFQELSSEEMTRIWPLVSEEPLPLPLRLELAEGSMRMALTMSDDMSALYRQMVEMLAPGIPRDQIVQNIKAQNIGSRSEALGRARLLFQLLFSRLARIAAGVRTGDDAEMRAAQYLVTKLPAWAEISQEIQNKIDDAMRLNLDVEVTILDAWLSIDELLRKP